VVPRRLPQDVLRSLPRLENAHNHLQQDLLRSDAFSVFISPVLSSAVGNRGWNLRPEVPYIAILGSLLLFLSLDALLFFPKVFHAVEFY